MTRKIDRLVAVGLVGAVLLAAEGASAKVPPCPGGRYLVFAGAMLPSAAMSGPDVLTVAGRTLGIASGCAVTKARVRAGRAGTRVIARWTGCDGVDGRVKVRGTITEYCRTFTGSLVSRSAGLNVPFIASLSACGDGVWDAEGGEACDGTLGPCGDLCSTCQCPGGVTTTTTTPGSSTTIPGGVTTTTIPGGGTTTTTIGGGGTTTSTTVVTTTNPPTSTTVVVTTSTTMPTFPTTSTTSTTMPGPDLHQTSFSCASSAPSGATILVTYSVRNSGMLTATAPWWDYVLISSDATFGGDTAFGLYQRMVSVAPNGSYSVSQNMTLPMLPPGQYYVFLQVDGAAMVTESLESNNVSGPVALTITS